MQIIFKKKEVWDIVDDSKPELITAGQIKKKKKYNAVATKIIK